MSDHETKPDTGAAAKGGKSGMLGKLMILAFLAAVIGGECLLACFYLPTVAASAPAAATQAEAEHGDHAEHGDEGHAPATGASHEHASKGANTREVDLGKFSLTAFQPSSNSTLLIDFHLFATVAADPHEASAAASGGGGHGGGGHGGGHGEKGKEDKPDDEFSRTYDKHKHRIRDQIITIVRSADITDFADPSLGLIRRKILEKSNRTLGKPLLHEVIFSDFSLIEQ